MTAPRHEPRTPSSTTPPPRPHGAQAPCGVSMSDLLASCAAASAVSTPPAAADAQGAPAAEADEAEGRAGRRARRRVPSAAAVC
ncbi:hypothetical protein GCM10023082_35180 [Streptomyces tremellae]|uniref:Uncharacterized protein n=2 Tax=Streptomyces tremellae TaxID=1124239 RepID=A0ABP7FAY7_9ACTN